MPMTALTDGLQAAARGMLVRAAMRRQREATLAASTASRPKGTRQSVMKLQRKGSMGSSGSASAVATPSRKASTLTTRKSGASADAASDTKPPRSISGAPVPPLVSPAPSFPLAGRSKTSFDVQLTASAWYRKAWETAQGPCDWTLLSWTFLSWKAQIVMAICHGNGILHAF